MLFFDINSVIGLPLFDIESGNYSGYKKSSDLIADMDFYGIDYSFVYHNSVFSSEPMKANLRLLEEIKNEKRLLPCWVLLPSNTQDIWKKDNILNDIEKYGIRALRIFPDFHNINLGLPFIDELFKELEKKAMLLIIQYRNLGVAVPDPVGYDMVVLDYICTRFPGLNIVSSGPLRQFYYLLEKHDNLYFSLEWEMHSGIIKDITDRFGAEKILFGTPNCEISSELSGAVISMLNYSEISHQDKMKIAGQNLIAVLNKKKKADTKFNKIINITCSKIKDTGIKKSFKEFPYDDFILSAYKGSSLPYPVIDCHYHAGEFASEFKPGSSIDTLAGLLKREDIKSMFINSSEAVFGGDHCTGNRYVYDLCLKYPECITGFYVFNPNFKESCDEMNKYLSDKNFKGIKIHPRIHKCDINDKKYIPVWEAAKRFKVPVLSHTGEGQAHSDPGYFYDISEKYSDVTFILAHGGESFKGILQSIEIVNSRKNVYIDISGWGFMHKGVLEFVSKKVGAEKLLFGSDAGWIDFNYAVGVVIFSRLSQPDKEKILCKNARKILKNDMSYR